MSTGAGTGSGTGAGTGSGTQGTGLGTTAASAASSSLSTKVNRGYKATKDYLKLTESDIKSLFDAEASKIGSQAVCTEEMMDQIKADWVSQASLDASKAGEAALTMCLRCIDTGYSDQVTLSGKICGVDADHLLTIAQDTCTFRQIARMFANHIWNFCVIKNRVPSNALKYSVKNTARAALEIIDYVESAAALMPEGGIRRPPSNKERKAAATIRDMKLMLADRKDEKSGSTSAYITQGRMEGNLPSIR